VPVRGAIATVGTVGALALLLSFRGGPLAPGDIVLSANDDAISDDELTTSATETSGAAVEAVVQPQTITGDLVSTRFGDVQVEVTLEGPDIVEVVALSLPAGDHHSAKISDGVEPILAEEAVAIDSADISVVSGATYTSRAYAASLQSALDQLGF
jgi:FMN-binding domain